MPLRRRGPAHLPAMSRSGTCAIFAIMNSSSPYGGVTSPSMMFVTATTPKWTGSMPSACAVAGAGYLTARILSRTPGARDFASSEPGLG